MINYNYYNDNDDKIVDQNEEKPKHNNYCWSPPPPTLKKKRNSKSSSKSSAAALRSMRIPIAGGEAVRLPPDALATYSKLDFEHYLKDINLDALSGPEHKELRRQRRLILNREYAQMSRNRQKRFEQTLHQRIKELEDENHCLRLYFEKMKNDYKALSQLALPDNDKCKCVDPIVGDHKAAVFVDSFLLLSTSTTPTPPPLSPSSPSPSLSSSSLPLLL